MTVRTVIATCCVVAAVATPAAAQDGCTTDLRDKLVGDLFTAEPGDPPYPIVERDESGSVHVHPQNVVPAATYTIGNVTATVDRAVGAVVAWVDCVD